MSLLLFAEQTLVVGMYCTMYLVISICLFYVKYMQDSHEYGNNTRKKYDNKEEIVI